MAKYRQLFLTVNVSTGALMDPDNTTRKLSQSEFPAFNYLEQAILCLTLIDATGTAVVLGAADAFECAIDNNFLHTDDLIAYADNDDVDIADDWADIDRATGKISIRVNLNTVSAGTKLSNDAEILPYIQVYRTPSGETDAATILNAKCTLANRVKATEGSPVSSDPEYLTAVQVNSLFSARFRTRGLGDAIRMLGTDDGVQYEAFVKTAQWTVSDQTSA